MAKLAAGKEARTSLPRRRFRVLDVMILVAATAIACPVGLWIAQQFSAEIFWSGLYKDFLSLFDSSDGDGMILEEAVALGGFFFLLFAPFAAAWTIALALIQLAGRREPLRSLANRPGAAAIFPAGITCAFVSVILVLKYHINDFYNPHSPFSLELMFLLLPMLVGASVSGSWMMLLIGRRWNAEPSWIDRLGRALGVFWVIAGVALTSLLLVM